MPLPGRSRPWTASLRAIVDGIDDAPVRWRVLAVLYLTAAPLAGVTLFLPHGHGTTDWAIAALVVSALAIGTALLVLAGRLPRGGVGALLAVGTLMITGCILAGGDTGGPYALLYVWAGVEGFFFLRARGALLLNAFIAACYGAALLALPTDGSAPSRWILT